MTRFHPSIICYIFNLVLLCLALLPKGDCSLTYLPTLLLLLLTKMLCLLYYISTTSVLHQNYITNCCDSAAGVGAGVVTVLREARSSHVIKLAVIKVNLVTLHLTASMHLHEHLMCNLDVMRATFVLLISMTKGQQHHVMRSVKIVHD